MLSNCYQYLIGQLSYLFSFLLSPFFLIISKIERNRRYLFRKRANSSATKNKIKISYEIGTIKSCPEKQAEGLAYGLPKKGPI